MWIVSKNDNIAGELTCKILPGGEGSPVVHRALQHPEVRSR